MIRKLPVVTLVATTILAACDGEAPGSRTVRTDSAGVQIVAMESFVSEAPEWMVSPSPELEIGLADGDAAYQFYTIRGLLRLSDGRIVVADGGSQELRYFDLDGTHLVSVGAEGEGPGEFQDLYAIFAGFADSIAAYDFADRSISWFGPEGGFARSIPLELSGGGTWLSGVLEDGSLLVSGSVRASRPEGVALYANEYSLFTYHPDGTLRDTVGIFPGLFIAQTETRRVPLPFGLSGRLGYGVDEGAVVVGVPMDRAVRSYSSGGDLVSVIRSSATAKIVTTDSLRVQYEAEFVDLDGLERDEARAEMEEALRTIPFPDTRPDFDRFLIDTEGNLWLREWRWPNQSPAPWFVYSTAGDILGTVRLPTDIDVREIGPNYILGVVQDDLDIERVRIYGLQRGG